MSEQREAEGLRYCTGRTSCANAPSPTRHSCPYQREINDDAREDYCACCDECTQECAWDV